MLRYRRYHVYCAAVITETSLDAGRAGLSFALVFAIEPEMWAVALSRSADNRTRPCVSNAVKRLSAKNSAYQLISQVSFSEDDIWLCIALTNRSFNIDVMFGRYMLSVSNPIAAKHAVEVNRQQADNGG